MVKFNLVGFNFNRVYNKTYIHCSIHPYKRLLESKTDLTVLFCPECGSEYPVKDTVKEQDIQTDVPPGNSNQTKIISAKRKHKFYDSFANLIPEDDTDAIADMQGGKKIVYYKEEKKGDEEYHIIKK